jgi:hypothetical protein
LAWVRQRPYDPFSWRSNVSGGLLLFASSPATVGDSVGIILPLTEMGNIRDKRGLDFMTKIFGLIALAGLVVGIIGGHSVPGGLGKAVFGVFFILVFLAKLGDFWSAERPETTHDHGGLMGKGGHGHDHSH